MLFHLYLLPFGFVNHRQPMTTTMHHDDDAHLAPVNEEMVFELTRPHPNLWKLFLIYAFLSNVAIFFTILPLYFRFKTLRYRFDHEGLAVSYGLLFRKETYLTYARIQDIHVTRNIFERWLGIGTVEIQTASGSSDAAESIVGVTQFNEIRNFLYARMRGHRSTSTLATAGAGDAAGMSEVNALLAGIRDELRQIRLAAREHREEETGND